MKKKIISCGLLALAAISISACGNGENNPDVPVEGGIIDTPVTITVWTTAGTAGQNILSGWVEDFKKVEPNVTVNNVKQSGGYDDLKTMIETGFSGNNYPDLAYCYPDHVADYINYGKAMRLDQFIDNPDYGWTEEEKADFIPAYLEEGQKYTIEGTYSLPFSKSTEAMFYNEDVLVGLDLSGIDATINNGMPLTNAYLQNLTWEELFEKLCPALIEYDKTNNIIEPCDDGVTRVFGYDSDDNLFITLAQQYGYPYTGIKDGKGTIDFNTKEMKDLLVKFSDYYKKGYLITKGTNEDAYVNELFTANQLLFSVGSTGGMTYQFNSNNPMNVGVGMIPQAAEGTPATIMQGPSMCILDHSDSNRSLAAWLFYKFITEEENTLEWGLSSTGYYPIRRSNLTDPAYLELSDETAAPNQSLEKLIARGFSYFTDVESTLFTSPVFKGSSTAREQVGGLLTQTLLNPSNVDSLFNEAVEQCTLAL